MENQLAFLREILCSAMLQKTNAVQSSKNILMSDDATINTKPHWKFTLMM